MPAMIVADETRPYCTCSKFNTFGYARAGDQIWVHALCGKMSKLVWEGYIGMENPELYYALPPRGLTRSTARVGNDYRYHFTFFCPDNEACYAVAYGLTEETARRGLANHLCPAEIRRDQHPSGKPASQKMWDELDEVIAKIKNADTVDDGSYAAAVPELRGYARGLAMAIAFCGAPYWRDRDDVLRQANKRWKMAQGEIPRESTPGYNAYPVDPADYVRREVALAPRQTGTTAKKATTKKASPKAGSQPARSLGVEEQKLIKQAVTGGTPVEDIAKMFGVSVAMVRALTSPPAPSAPPMLGALF